MLMARLEVLCENGCEDLALRLAEACVRWFDLKDSRFHDNPHESRLNYIKDTLPSDLPGFRFQNTTEDIRDTYLALLYRFNRSGDIIAEVERMNISDSLRLVKRNSATSKNKEGAKMNSKHVWKYRGKVAELGAHTLLSSAMIQPVTDQTLLKEIVQEWISINEAATTRKMLESMVCRMVEIADSSQHIYIICKVLVEKKFSHPFCIETYIRALTANLNEIEEYKIKKELDKGSLMDSEVRLSNGLLCLADLMKDVSIRRECILSAFSLNPNGLCYDRLRSVAVASGKHPSPTRNRSCSKRNTSWNTSYQPALNLVLNTETTGLTHQLCEDLVIVLSSKRHKMLSWDLEWPELSCLCREYMLLFKH